METQTSRAGQESRSSESRSAEPKSKSKAKRTVSRSSEPQGSLEFDPKLLLVTARRCWPWATPIGVALGAAIAFVIYSRFVPIYQATHLLEANQDYVLFEKAIPIPKNLAVTEKQLIYTDLVLDAVISQPDVQKIPGFAVADIAKGDLRRNLSIGNAGADTLLTISYKHPDPQVATLICNKVTEAYLAQREKLDNDRVSNLESWLAPSIESWKTESEMHEKRVRDLSKATFGFDPSQPIEAIEMTSVC